MWLFCALIVQLFTLWANVQGSPLQGESIHDENHSSVRNSSAFLKEKYVCTFPQNVYDEIQDEKRQRFKSSLPVCISVSGFSSRDFTGNGIYCRGPSIESIDGKETNDQQKSGHYYYTSSPTLRYEMRPEKSLWALLRVIKTKGGKWIGRPIYAGMTLNRTEIPKKNFTKEPANISPTNIEWVGVMQKQSPKGGIDFDRSEPNLQVNEINPPKEYMQLRWALQSHISGSIDVCTAFACSLRLQDDISKYIYENIETNGSDDNNMNIKNDDDDLVLQTHTMKMLSQLAEMIGRNDEAIYWNKKTHDRVKEEITNFATEQKPIPRMLRWLFARSSLDLARSYTKSKRLSNAIDSILAGLANSPEQRQRRQLFQNLGDLRLASVEIEGAKASYEQAKNAVKTKGGNVDDVSFWGDFDDEDEFNSIGSILTNTLRPGRYKMNTGSGNETKIGYEGNEEGKKKSYDNTMMSPSFGSVRAKILLGLDSGKDWEEILNKLHNSNWLDVWDYSSQLFDGCFLDDDKFEEE